MASTRTRRTPKKRRDWKPAWLAAFRATGMVTTACEAVGIGRSTVYDARSDEAFAEAWDAIEAETTDIMEREARRRAVEGVEEPVVSGGKMLGTVTKYSDTLLIFLLKARKPQMYRDNNVKVEHSGKIEGTIVEVPVSRERAAEVGAIMAGATGTDS